MIQVLPSGWSFKTLIRQIDLCLVIPSQQVINDVWEEIAKFVVLLRKEMKDSLVGKVYKVYKDKAFSQELRLLACS